MRVLSLDVGSKKIGISISSEDRSLIFALPALKIEKFRGEVFFNRLKNHLMNYWSTVDTVIIGNPHHEEFQNSICFISEQIHRIFKSWTNWEVFFISETNSTVDSRDLLRKLNFSRKKKSKNLDSYAALILLDDFLEFRNFKHTVNF